MNHNLVPKHLNNFPPFSHAHKSFSLEEELVNLVWGFGGPVSGNHLGADQVRPRFVRLGPVQLLGLYTFPCLLTSQGVPLCSLYSVFQKDGPDLRSLHLCNHEPPMNETLTT